MPRRISKAVLDRIIAEAAKPQKVKKKPKPEPQKLSRQEAAAIAALGF